MANRIVRAADVAHWDEEVDVIVVGLGAAGAAAALETASAGARTLVLERASGGGGTSAMSGGVLYLGGGTALQKACGFEDSADEMFKYLMASVGRTPDEAKIRLYCDGSVEHYSWLVGQGVPFKPVFYEGCSGEPPTDDGLVWSGSEQCHPYRDIAVPAPRGHVPRMTYQTGPLLMRVLVAAVAASRARVAADHRVRALVRDGDAIAGVIAETFGARRALRARRGVVLTTGGFIHNDRMLDAHAPLARRCSVRVGAEGDDGSGIQLGVAAGAATLHMDAVSISLPVTQPWGLKRGILVDAQGQRFVNEDAYYGRLGEVALLHRGGRAWLVVDDAVFEKPTYDGHPVCAVGDTPAELERELALPDGSLAAALALYNRHAEAGVDPLFHKDPRYLAPLVTPPFGAFDCTTERSLYAAFTLGGLHTDPDGRVLDGDGDAIPGLFAAGRCSSGLSVGGYSSGLSLGDGTFFGRRAGRSAARD